MSDSRDPKSDEASPESTPAASPDSDLCDFGAFCAIARDLLSRSQRERSGSMYCPECGGARRFDVRLLNQLRPQPHGPGLNLAGNIPEQLLDTIYRLTCRQCSMVFTALVYAGPSGPAHAVLPSKLGGVRTRHTPEGVAYYLDQAFRCQSMAANSAAVAMYRGALEHLLYEQRFQDGMLRAKVAALEDAIARGMAPSWATDLDTAFLTVIKDLGNGSIHPNDGDVTKQGALDSVLLAKLQTVFSLLLFSIYEVPHEKAEFLTQLKARVAVLKK